ncbi:hypothetical protein Q5P01_008327 [Channa striata]|uniref:FISNA domain-containing protein n=1 Tax=Channa striata TaxID=64152 RepID=A0AA88N9Z2_CHASR|nr:hypothetical protein Q5P01_008327 [Channa striata]
MDQCEDGEEGVPPSKRKPESQRPEKLHRPDSAGPGPEPNFVSTESNWSMEPPFHFRQSADERVDEQSLQVPSGQSAKQHQTHLDSIFMLLEDNIVTFVKNELKKIQNSLSPDYQEWLEDEEMCDGEDEKQRRSNRESVLKITVNVLRRMKEEQLADCLHSKTSDAGCQHKLKLNLQKKFQIVFEGITKTGNPVLLNQIYTELYVTEGGTGEVNDEHEGGAWWRTMDDTRSEEVFL